MSGEEVPYHKEVQVPRAAGLSRCYEDAQLWRASMIRSPPGKGILSVNSKEKVMNRIRIAAAVWTVAMPAKRRMFAFAAMVSIIAATAKPDYSNPPAWQDNPYFTHQTWQFRTGASPVNADIDLNPFGESKLGIHGDNIRWSEYEFAREGVWTIEQGWAQIEGIIFNEENEDLSKEIWIQATLHTSIRGGVPIDILFEFPDGTYTVTPIDSSVIVAPDGWLYQTYLFDLTPQPDWEVVGLNFSLPTGAYVAIDQLDIDTRCIPEPATLLLLALGGFLSLRRCTA